MIIERGNWMLDLTEEWSEWFRPNMNWRNFTLIQVYYEDECHLGNRELVVRLLGFGMRIVHVYDEDAEGRTIINERLLGIRANADSAQSEETEHE